MLNVECLMLNVLPSTQSQHSTFNIQHSTLIRTATIADLEPLRDLLARANDTPYDLGAVAEEKCFEAGVEGEPRVRVYGDFDGVAVTCGKYLRILAVDRHKRRRGLGSALLDDSEATVAFAEGGNYFSPGVYAEDDNTVNFLTNRGWRETARTWNLVADQRRPGFSPAMDTLAEDSRAEARPTLTHRALHTDRDRVLEFIEREFGRIWRFEVARAFACDVPPLFITEESGAITGFAAHDINNRGLGFFGPTGVARSMRGRGLGRQLLLASLADLRAMGYARVIIPWTDALEFYAKSCGATPLHRFVTLVR
jgi:GNAT superfamily N-acetyltransferase